ncbi:mutS protein homolog 4-like, partial [Limulus polyphemus]|uniref:MutS protein homolog 4-like n=1 Tax=Limulus polyphemus TaxID=6850 RepID=A0ABM1BA68_LIMPO
MIPYTLLIYIPDFSELKTATHSRQPTSAGEVPIKANKSSSSCFSSPTLSKRRPRPRQQNPLLCNQLVGTNRGSFTVSSGRTPGSCHRLRGRTPLSRTTTSTCTDHIHRTPRVSTSTTTLYAPEKSIIVAIVEGRGLARGEVGMASLDLRNPELLLSQFSDSQAYVKVLTKLRILEPIEIIVPNTAWENVTGSRIVQQITDQYPDTTIATVQRKYFNEAKGLQYINHLCVPEYSSVEMEVATKYYCLAAGAALLKYVEFIQNVLYAPHSLKIIFRGSENTAVIDFATAKNLELLVNLCDPKSDHSLFGILHHTKTVGGSRFLRANILQPPCHQETIETRLNCVEELTENEELFFSLQAVLGRFLDVEHLLSLCIQIPKQENTRTAEQKITNIIYLKHTLELVEPLRAALDHSNNPLFRTYYESLKDDRFEELLEIIHQVVHDDTRYQKGALNMRSQKCFAIKPNINGLLDVARRMYTESMDDIVEMIRQLGEKHNLPLKTNYNMLKGFYIQLYCDRRSNITVKNLPPVFIKVVKNKNTLNFTTEDL